MSCCVDAVIKGTETGMGLCMHVAVHACVSLIHTAYVCVSLIARCRSVGPGIKFRPLYMLSLFYTELWLQRFLSPVRISVVQAGLNLLYRSGWPQAVDPPASFCLVLGSQARAIMPWTGASYFLSHLVMPTSTIPKEGQNFIFVPMITAMVSIDCWHDRFSLTMETNSRVHLWEFANCVN